MHRYKINVEYKGTNYVGWQRQNNGMSIQESLETAINQLTAEKVDVFGAGRTDSGVHALNQVGHFDLKKIMELDSIRDDLVVVYCRLGNLSKKIAEKLNYPYYFIKKT